MAFWVFLFYFNSTDSVCLNLFDINRFCGKSAYQRQICYILHIVLNIWDFFKGNYAVDIYYRTQQEGHWYGLVREEKRLEVVFQGFICPLYYSFNYISTKIMVIEASVKGYWTNSIFLPKKMYFSVTLLLYITRNLLPPVLTLFILSGKTTTLPTWKGTIPFYFAFSVEGAGTAGSYQTALKYKSSWQDCMYNAIEPLYLSDCVR